MNDKTKLAVKEELAPEVLRPAGSVAQIVAAYKEYEELKRQLLTDNDWYSVAGQPPKLRRSGWQKLATAFALEDDLVEESEIQDSVDPAHWTVKITVEARAKSGRTSTGVGACSTREFQWRLDADGRITYPQLSKRTGQYEVMPLAHFVRTKAHTRAKLRAIADMLGGAEQVEEEESSSRSSLLRRPPRPHPQRRRRRGPRDSRASTQGSARSSCTTSRRSSARTSRSASTSSRRTASS